MALEHRISDSDTVLRIVAASRALFARDGVSRTGLGAVAEEVGIARQTLYDHVRGRQHLIELALAERCFELLEVFALKLGSQNRSTREALVELMAAMVETCSADPEFARLATAMPRASAFDALSGPSALRPPMREAFRDLFDRARDEGILREDVSEESMVGWIQTVLTPLAGRSDMHGDELRSTLEQFALPALLVPHDT